MTEFTNNLGKVAVDADPLPTSYLTDGTWYQKIVRTTAGRLYKISCSNGLSSNIYLKIYNKGASLPVPGGTGTDVPVLRFLIPPQGREISLPIAGVLFTNGISFVLTKGSMQDNDTTAVDANSASVNPICN